MTGKLFLDIFFSVKCVHKKPGEGILSKNSGLESKSIQKLGDRTRFDYIFF